MGTKGALNFPLLNTSALKPTQGLSNRPSTKQRAGLYKSFYASILPGPCYRPITKSANKHPPLHLSYHNFPSSAHYHFRNYAARKWSNETAFLAADALVDFPIGSLISFSYQFVPANTTVVC
jgi:hypothetical protein